MPLLPAWHVVTFWTMPTEPRVSAAPSGPLEPHRPSQARALHWEGTDRNPGPQVSPAAARVPRAATVA